MFLNPVGVNLSYNSGKSTTTRWPMRNSCIDGFAVGILPNRKKRCRITPESVYLLDFRSACVCRVATRNAHVSLIQLPKPRNNRALAALLDISYQNNLSSRKGNKKGGSLFIDQPVCIILSG